MKFGGGAERRECRTNNDVCSDRDVVKPFYGMILATFQRLHLDDFLVETLGSLARSFEVLDARGADVDPDRFAEFREVVFGGRAGGPDVVEEGGLFGHCEFIEVNEVRIFKGWIDVVGRMRERR
jgi:hypothetical protein